VPAWRVVRKLTHLQVKTMLLLLLLLALLLTLLLLVLLLLLLPAPALFACSRTCRRSAWRWTQARRARGRSSGWLRVRSRRRWLAPLLSFLTLCTSTSGKSRASAGHRQLSTTTLTALLVLTSSPLHEHISSLPSGRSTIGSLQ